MGENFSAGSYSSSEGQIPVRLGINEASVESYEKGCVPGNLGIRRQVGDRVFRLALVKLTSVIGKLYGLDTAAAANLSAEIVGTATVGFVTAVAVGRRRVSITDATHLSATTKDFYANGYLFITNGTGEGQCLKIKSNEAASSNLVVFDLYDPLAVAVDTTSDVVLMANPWGDMLLTDENAGNNLTQFMGVSQCAATVTSTAYMYQWLQTWGPCVVLAEAAGTEGLPVMHSPGGSHDGGVDEWDTVTDISGGQIGTTLSAATAAGDYQATFLTIMP